MKFVGLILVLLCTFGGLVLAAGFEKAMHLLTGAIIPAAPGEFVIIMGCALSAFLIANSMDVIKGAGRYMSALAKPAAYSKDDYTELLCMMYAVFKLARSKGWLAIEQHIENPEETHTGSRQCQKALGCRIGGWHLYDERGGRERLCSTHSRAA